MECTGEIEMGSGRSPWDLPTIRFPGQYYDDESKLHCNRFRYYDPGNGRYVSADPIGQFDSLPIIQATFMFVPVEFLLDEVLKRSGKATPRR